MFLTGCGLKYNPNHTSSRLVSECVFGNQIRELGSTWVPNLGIPIGILYCMKCECIQVSRTVAAAKTIDFVTSDVFPAIVHQLCTRLSFLCRQCYPGRFQPDFSPCSPVRSSVSRLVGSFFSRVQPVCCVGKLRIAPALSFCSMANY